MDDAEFIRKMAMESNEFFGNSLPMIASENVMSPLAKEMLITDFEGRYAEGKPGARYYQGCKYVDEVERKCEELGKKLFDCSYINVQAISGTVANLAAYAAFASPGDSITAFTTSKGAHISHQKFGAAGIRSLTVYHYPYDIENLNIDIEGSKKLIREIKPKIALFGQSLFLFPLPINELKDAVAEVGAKVVYDGAHVMGLMAGKKFQDPLKEGADLVTGSTHKTLPGPQGGILLGNMEDEKEIRRVDRKVFPGLVSNHHLHRLAALGITLAEELAFGKEYAVQTIKNAKALGQAFCELGFKVLGENLGFTESHQIAVDVKEYGGAPFAAERLERCGIIANINLLPYDDPKKPKNPSGLRLGVQELTRTGMKESEMKHVAEFFKKSLMDEKDEAEIKKEVAEFRKDFRTVKYCFNEEDAYAYKKLVA
jgi:glycine hydroxymethyltransferase